MDLIDTSAPSSEFRIFSGLLKTSRSGDGKMRLHGVASSTTKDLHGDVMTQSAIDDMEKAANNNLTIYLNHSYEVPEDVAGSVEHAKSFIRGVDHEGNPNIDLDFDIVINDENPRAVTAFKAIEKGTKLGLSIGAMIPEGGAKRTKAGAYIIEHVELLETSLVSIPANPRSWVDYAAKSLRSKKWATEPVAEDVVDAATCPECGGAKNSPKGDCHNAFHGQKDVEPTVVDESHPELPDSAFACIDSKGRHYPHHTASGAVDKGLLRSALSRCGDASNTHCGCAHIRAHAKKLGIGEDEKSFDDLLTLAVSDGHDEEHFNLDAEPDVTDATVTVETPFANITVDTSDNSGSAQSSTEPVKDETAEGDDGALGDTTTRSIEPVVTQSLDETLGLLNQATRDLVQARAQLVEAQMAKAIAERERDDARSERDHVLTQTQQILSRVADSPLVRRAVVMDAQRSFRARFEGIYDEDVLKMLERNDNA